MVNNSYAMIGYQFLYICSSHSIANITTNIPSLSFEFPWVSKLNNIWIQAGYRFPNTFYRYRTQCHLSLVHRNSRKLDKIKFGSGIYLPLLTQQTEQRILWKKKKIIFLAVCTAKLCLQIVIAFYH